MANGGEVFMAEPPKIQEANSIGAGDALVAGLVEARIKGLPPQKGLRWGVACGSAAAALPGTAFADRPQVEAIYNQVRLIKLD